MGPSTDPCGTTHIPSLCHWTWSHMTGNNSSWWGRGRTPCSWAKCGCQGHGGECCSLRHRMLRSALIGSDCRVIQSHLLSATHWQPQSKPFLWCVLARNRIGRLKVSENETRGWRPVGSLAKDLSQGLVSLGEGWSGVTTAVFELPKRQLSIFLSLAIKFKSYFLPFSFNAKSRLGQKPIVVM